MSLRLKRVRVLSVLAIPALVAGLLGFVPAPAQADGGTPPPSCTIELVSGDASMGLAPVCDDPAGGDQDRWKVPTNSGLDWYFYPNVDNIVTAGNWYYMDGSSNTVKLATEQWNGSGYSVGPVYKLTFDRNTAVTELAPSFVITLGQCGEYAPGFTSVYYDGTNTFDGSGRYDSFILKAVRSDSWSPSQGYKVGLAEYVLDGETRMHVPLGTSQGPGDDPGLLPGDFEISAYTWDPRTQSFDITNPIATFQLSIPACDDQVPPGGGGGGPTVVKPSANLVQTGAHKMRANLKKGTAKVVNFRIVVDPLKGKTKVRPVKLTSATKKVVVKGLKDGTTVRVKARINGKWKVLDHKRLQRGSKR